ncbi:MAG: class I SAM-dependent methyltransferase [Granulosicoccus sp.]
MNSQTVSGTEGYAEEASVLLQRYEMNSFSEVYAAVMHHIPSVPSRIADIGAGSGRDAGYLAKQGHQVVAVEPTSELREPAKKLHPSENIEWVDDSLPELTQLLHMQKTFDLVIMNAVWMHLDQSQREIAMTNIAKLTHSGTKIITRLGMGPFRHCDGCSMCPVRRRYSSPVNILFNCFFKHSVSPLVRSIEPRV